MSSPHGGVMPEVQDERATAVLWGTREGRSARDLAAALEVSERTVVRYRARLRKTRRLEGT